MHVVVTGGSSGIGLEVAKCYASRGAAVSLIARNAERLQAALKQVQSLAPSSGNICAAAADVADGEDLARAIRDCEALHGPCEILIASAGIVVPGFFHEQDEQTFRLQWDTNLLGVINAVRTVYPAMRSRRAGRIMIVSSAMAFIGIPAYSAYCASKSALVGFADALRLEALNAGVSVGICFPPDTDTPQLEQEIRQRPAAAQRLIGNVRVRPATWVAERIVEGVDRRGARVYFTAGIAALSAFRDVARIWVTFWLSRRLTGKGGS